MNSKPEAGKKPDPKPTKKPGNEVTTESSGEKDDRGPSDDEIKSALAKHFGGEVTVRKSDKEGNPVRDKDTGAYLSETAKMKGEHILSFNLDEEAGEVSIVTIVTIDGQKLTKVG